MAGAPEAEVEITAKLVRQLLWEQHSDWAQLPLGAVFQGWDNVSMRLGQELLVRLPRRELSARMCFVELDWLHEDLEALAVSGSGALARGRARLRLSLALGHRTLDRRQVALRSAAQ